MTFDVLISSRSIWVVSVLGESQKNQDARAVRMKAQQSDLGRVVGPTVRDCIADHHVVG
jgi:hypothetical protein